MPRIRRVAVWGVLIVAGGAGLGFALRPSSVLVEGAVVRQGPMQQTVDEEGRTRLQDRYLVAAPVAGRVERLGLREADSVRRGAVVAKMLPAPLDARARQQAAATVARADDAARSARAARAQAAAVLEQAKRSGIRARELGSQGLISPEEVERAVLQETSSRRELESADFRAQAAGHDVEVAKAALRADRAAPLLLRSPVNGVVLRIPERSERVVAAGEPLLEIGDPTHIEVVADLLSSEAVKVRPGDRLLVVGWGGADTLHGVLRVVEPSGFTKVSALGVEEQRVNIVGELNRPPAALGDRYRVELRIVIWESASVLQAPAGALFRRGDGWAAFVVRDGRAQLREVEVGHRTPFEAEIRSGLQEGDILVRNPSDRVGAGVRVRIRPR
jgi:HlyD family secretion protein